MSPQSRRGHAAPPSHRKPAPRVPSDATAKPGKGSAADVKPAAAQAAAPTAPESAVETPSKSAAPVAPSVGKPDKGKTATRPAERKAASVSRRGGSPVRSGRRSALRNVYSYLSAFMPVFIAMLIIFTGIWVWTSFGPHTPSPKENWTSIETNWKPKRDADLKAISVAVAANDFNATIAGYKAASADTRSWVDDLTKIKDWEVAAASQDPNQVATATTLVAMVIQDGTSEVAVLDKAAAAKTPNEVLALKDQLDATDTTFLSDLDSARQVILGSAPAPSGQPTIAMPSGSLSPSGSPAASGVAPSAPAASTPAPSASAS